jgi:hypothetical protein
MEDQIVIGIYALVLTLVLAIPTIYLYLRNTRWAPPKVPIVPSVRAGHSQHAARSTPTATWGQPITISGQITNIRWAINN